MHSWQLQQQRWWDFLGKRPWHFSCWSAAAGQLFSPHFWVTMSQCHQVTMSPYHNVTMSHFWVTMSQCLHITMSLCDHVIMSPNQNVTMSHFWVTTTHHVTMSQFYNTISRSHLWVLWWSTTLSSTHLGRKSFLSDPSPIILAMLVTNSLTDSLTAV